MSGAATHVATALVAAAVAAGGAWKVQDWRWTASTKTASLERAEEDRIAGEQRELDARQQRGLIDTAAGEHAAALAGLNTQLGDAHAHIARLSDRQCLAAGTVRMLNAIGTPAAGLDVRAPAGDPAGAPEAAAGSAPDDAAAGYASERDTAGWIAACRAQYGAVSSQLDKILDIEDRRGQGVQASAP